MYKNSVLCDGLTTDYLQDITLFIQEWLGKSNTITVHTSGSTGQPKELKLSKEKVRISARATGRFFEFKPNQTILLNLSPNYIAGKLMIVRAIEHNMQLVIAPNKANPLLDLPDDLKVDFGAFVPYQLAAILTNPATKVKYERIDKAIIGGAPLSMELEQQVTQLNNVTYATFGMTETITHFALKNISCQDNFYTCLDGFTIAKDERNCLVLKENPITGKAIVTNDLIQFKNNKQFVWQGRIDHVVNSGGIKLSPELLEHKIARFLPHTRFYLIGKPSKRFGEALVLYIESEPYPTEELQLKMQEVLTKVELPKAIYFKTAFKETHTGKVKRMLL